MMQAEQLSRRERQIMDVVYRLGSASAADVQGTMPDPPSYSAVRAQLAILEEKGYLKHEKKQRKYIYAPTVAPSRAKRSALKQLLATFFDNSAVNLVAALLDSKDQKLTQEEIDRIHRLIEDDQDSPKPEEQQV
jgi:predicted transcriptional regulator